MDPLQALRDKRAESYRKEQERVRANVLYAIELLLEREERPEVEFVTGVRRSTWEAMRRRAKDGEGTSPSHETLHGVAFALGLSTVDFYLSTREFKKAVSKAVTASAGPLGRSAATRGSGRSTSPDSSQSGRTRKRWRGRPALFVPLILVPSTQEEERDAA